MARPRRGWNDLEGWITQAEELLRKLAEKNVEIYDDLAAPPGGREHPTPSMGRAQPEFLEGWGAWAIPYIALPDPHGGDLLNESNWNSIQQMVAAFGEEARFWNDWQGNRYVLFWTWYAAGEDEDEEQPSHAASEIYETEAALENYPVLDEDDHSRREMEATNENFRDEGSRFLRDARPGEEVDENNNPKGWLGKVMTWFVEHPDASVSDDLNSRDGGGGYPSEDNMLQALHELGLLDPDYEEEYFSKDWEAYEFVSRNVTIKLEMQHGQKWGKDAWNGNARGSIETGKHRWNFAPVRFARLQDRMDGLDTGAVEVAGAVLNTILRQDKDPAMSDAIRENIDADFPTEEDRWSAIIIRLKTSDTNYAYTLKEYGGTVVSWADFTWTETNPQYGRSGTETNPRGTKTEIAGRKRRS